MEKKSKIIWFYKYDRDLNKYIEIKEPEYIKHFCSFAIG